MTLTVIWICIAAIFVIVFIACKGLANRAYTRATHGLSYRLKLVLSALFWAFMATVNILWMFSTLGKMHPEVYAHYANFGFIPLLIVSAILGTCLVATVTYEHYTVYEKFSR